MEFICAQGRDLHLNDRIYLTDLGKPFTSSSNIFLDACWILKIKSIENR